jgi:hypothetical protein
MRVSIKTACWSLCLLLTTSTAPYAQEKSPGEMEKSCRTFVQGFYNWYVRKLTKDSPKGEPLDLKRNSFDPELRRQLKAYDAVDRDGVGTLDFDPFITGQDFSPAGYAAGKVVHRNGRYFVDVYCLGGCFGDGTNKRVLVVIPELMYQDGQWRFMNFHYVFPDGSKGDLLSLLKEDRKEDPKGYEKLRRKRSR